MTDSLLEHPITTTPAHRCSKCGGPGPFYPRKDRKSGWSSWCQQCQRDRAAAYQKDHLPQQAARNKRWYRKHRDAAYAISLAWRRMHPEVCRASCRAWREAHPEYDRAKAERRRALKQGTADLLTEQEWQDILSYFGRACAYCLRTDRPLTQDHIVPLTRGGTHSAENVVPACRSCNSRKHNRSVLRMVNIC
jgi:5-methylcytosine-specific restriction endonuclease McrA